MQKGPKGADLWGQRRDSRGAGVAETEKSLHEPRFISTLQLDASSVLKILHPRARHTRTYLLRGRCNRQRRQQIWPGKGIFPHPFDEINPA